MWRVACALAVSCQPALAGWSEGVPGAEVGRLVRAAMAAAGVETPAFADPVRAFPACAGDPVVGPRGGSWATAELRCPAPVWVRALRTGAEAEKKVASRAAPVMAGPPVATLARSIAKGAVITADDIVLQPMSERGVEGAFTDPAEVIGRRAKVMLGEGQPVLVRQLEPQWLVEAGNPLALTAEAGGLVVSAPAEALENGQMGDVIRVLNLSSQRAVKAVVTGRNIVIAQTNMR